MSENLRTLITLFFGGGGMVGLISLFFTRKTSKEKNELDMLDRAQKELERVDNKVIRLEQENKELEKEINEKEDLLRTNEHERNKLLGQLDKVLWELEETKAEAERLRQRIKVLEGDWKNGRITE